MSSTDRIEKNTLIRAPRARVWRALSDAKEFGEWFGVVLDGAFEAGAVVRGRITHPEYAHVQLEMIIERVEPERILAYRWHPYAVERGVDYSAEPTTLVELTLEEAPEGTMLTVVESGFDRIPLARRAEAFRMNSGGWAAQMDNVRGHVESAR
jgi:uncharacterized protein YndB with AHSA1/START domain